MHIDVDTEKTYAYAANRAFDPARHTVIFIHGAANDHSVWILQSRYCAYHGWNALAVDLPGHGKSRGKPLTSVPLLAEWIMKFVGAVGAPSTALVGHSMGALVALEAAARYPDRITKLALVGIAAPMPVSEGLLEASRANDHAAYEMINAFAHSNAAQLGGNPVPGQWMMGSSMRLMERSAPGALFADFSACNGYAGGLESARNVKCPTLLVLGKRDLMTPLKAAKDLMGAIPGVSTVTLEGAGHALMAERPDAVLDALIDHLR
jgi:pimeloyl-ACP methyl ester carboxylesterase